MADTGNSATVAFGTSSFEPDITNIEWGGITREDIDTSHLGTETAMTFIPGDLVDCGDVTLTIQYDADEQPAYSGAAEQITITYPSALANGATHVFTGYVNSFTPGQLANNELQEAEVVIKISGDVTFTDASA